MSAASLPGPRSSVPVPNTPLIGRKLEIAAVRDSGDIRGNERMAELNALAPAPISPPAERPKVKINAVDGQELAASLPELDPGLAERLVAYRAEHGPFRGPGDLAAVDGIGVARALALSPRLDWALPARPEPAPNTPQSKLWVLPGALLFAWVVATVTWPPFERSIEDASRGDRESLVSLWIAGSLLASQICAGIAVYTWLFGQDSVEEVWRRRLTRAAVAAGILGVLCLVSLGVSNAINYQYFAPNGWHDLLDDEAALAGLVCGVGAALLVLPQVPRLVSPTFWAKTWLDWIGDAAFVAWTVAAPIAAWTLRDELPRWLIAIAFAVSFALVGICAESFRERRSVSRLAFEHLVDRRLADETAANRAAWRDWIGQLLPLEEDREALARALAEKYGHATRRTVLSLLAGFGAGMLGRAFGTLALDGLRDAGGWLLGG